MKKSIISILILVVIGVLGYLILLNKKDGGKDLSITDFPSCAAAGNPIMESYPEQCRAPDGRTFTRDIGNELQKMNLIRITLPRPGDVVKSPLEITGEARGNWYFEASFPIELSDANGNILASHYATAQGEWMTENFVPFKSIIEFRSPTTATGTLSLRKDNPSGLPEHDDALMLPVKFSPSPNPPVVGKGDCRPTGCSGQVCSDEDVITTCEFRPEYACYKESFAKCERQPGGQCGWTPNERLNQCLKAPPAI